MDHAGSCHGLEQFLNFGRTLHEFVAPKVVVSVLDQFDESYQETPRMRPVNDQSFKKNSGDLLLNGLLVGLSKEIQ